MIQVFKEPAKKDWPSILARPQFDAAPLEVKVREILLAVKQRGDAAVKEYTLAFDKVAVSNFKLSAEKIEAAEKALTPSLKTAIQLAKVNIEVFHQGQIQKEERIETMPGVWCWRKAVGIEKVGIYIPGGSAPLFSPVGKYPKKLVPGRIAVSSDTLQGKRSELMMSLEHARMYLNGLLVISSGSSGD